MQKKHSIHLVKGNDVIGQKVMTVQTGKEVGKVQDLIYDPHDHKMKALLLDEGGWFSHSKIVLIEDVKGFGKDAVMIHSEDAIHRAKEVDQPIANIAKDDQYLTKTKIVTENGTELGKVSDILFDPNTGAVEELETTQGAFGTLKSGKKYVRIDQIVSIGRDATVVRGFTEQTFQDQAQNQGIQGAANRMSDSVQNTGEQIHDSPQTKNMIGTIKEKTHELKDAAQDEFHKLRNKQEVERPQDTVQQQTIKARLKSEEAGQEVSDSYARQKQSWEQQHSSPQRQDQTNKTQGDQPSPQSARDISNEEFVKFKAPETRPYQSIQSQGSDMRDKWGEEQDSSEKKDTDDTKTIR